MAQSVTQTGPAGEVSPRWAWWPRLHQLAACGIARRTAMRQVGLGLLALLVAVAGIATALDLRQAPHLGMLVAAGGRVVLLDPDGAAARAGIRIGDTITAIDGRAVAAAGFSSLRIQPHGAMVAVSEGTPGSFTLFWVPIVGPSQTELAGDGAALAAALTLWLSGLLVGLRRREVAAGLYALAALALALALCALVARDGGLFWFWPVLAPASLAGLGALALAHRALAGCLTRTVVAGAALVAGVPALLAALGAVVALPTIASAVVAAAPGLLAFAVLALPLVDHAGTSSAARRRRLRVAFLAAAAGLAPLCLWPGLVAIAALAGHRTATYPGVHVSALWGAAGLIPMALLDGALFLGPHVERLERHTRTGAAYVAALALLGSVLLAALPHLSWAGRVAALALAVLVLPVVQRGIAQLLDRVAAQAQPDYAAALRAVDNLAARATSPGDLALSVTHALPGLLAVRSAQILVRGLDCPPDAYRLFSAAGAGAEVVSVDRALEARTRDAARPVALETLGARSPAATLLRGLGATLWVPLWWVDAQRGVLVLGPRAGEDPYQEPDFRQISALAGTLALALHAQQLVSHLHERTTSLVALTHRLSQAHEQERAHLSRELHDVVAQELIALTRQLRRYSSEAPPPPAIWADMLAAAQDALAATRRICNGLRPAILDLGLVPALRDLVAEVRGREGGPEVGLTITGPERRLSGEVEFGLFRVAQEGLNNALAHSGARQVRVEACFEGGVCLRVRDDGGGFVVPTRLEDLPGDHLGLIGMRERLAELGGILIVTSTPGQGTVLEARVP
jgi:signal transduction histidine kinase